MLLVIYSNISGNLHVFHYESVKYMHHYYEILFHYMYMCLSLTLLFYRTLGGGFNLRFDDKHKHSFAKENVNQMKPFYLQRYRRLKSNCTLKKRLIDGSWVALSTPHYTFCYNLRQLGWFNCNFLQYHSYWTLSFV